jgi:NAD(P)-dependent dehydrogenase (short-subunit alcohol dehydrogenase family)
MSRGERDAVRHAGIVTGASSGIGKAITLKLAGVGMTVLACARDEKRLAEVAQLAVDLPGTVVAHVTDVTLEGDIVGAVSRADRELGGLRFIVNNAGILTHTPIHELTNEEWHSVEATNVRSVFWGCKHAIISMRRRGTGGSLVNMGSVMSLSGDPGFVAYATSKHAVLGLSRAIAVEPEYVRAGIRVNCVCPGDVDTPMMQAYFAGQDDPAGYRADMEADYPAGRMVTAKEVANLVAFLVSDEVPIMNGAALVLDGGRAVAY